VSRDNLNLPFRTSMTLELHDDEFYKLEITVSLSGLKSCDTSISYLKDYLPYQLQWVLHSITFELKAFFIYTAVFNQPVFMQC